MNYSPISLDNESKPENKHQKTRNNGRDDGQLSLFDIGEYGMMNNSRIYFMEKIDTVVLQGDLFIMSFDGEERSYYGWNQVVEKAEIINLFLFYLIIEVCC